MGPISMPLLAETDGALSGGGTTGMPLSGRGEGGGGGGGGSSHGEISTVSCTELTYVK